MNKIRILVTEDHLAVRMGLAASINCEPDLAVVGQAVNGLEAVQRYRELKPDLVIMDLHLPRMGGVEAIANISAEFPDARIIAWTLSESDDCLLDALNAGAGTYLLKSVGRKELLHAIRGLARGPDPDREHKEAHSGRT